MILALHSSYFELHRVVCWMEANERIRDLFWCLCQNSYGGVRKTSMEMMSFSEPKFEQGTLERKVVLTTEQ